MSIWKQTYWGQSFKTSFQWCPPFLFPWPGGCSLFWRSVCQAWIRMPCTLSCWTSLWLMATAGSTSMESGCQLGNQNHQTTAVSTSTQTLPTLGPIGWKLPFLSAKSNLPTSSMGVGRYGLIFPHHLLASIASTYQSRNIKGAFI